MNFLRFSLCLALAAGCTSSIAEDGECGTNCVEAGGKADDYGDFSRRLSATVPEVPAFGARIVGPIELRSDGIVGFESDSYANGVVVPSRDLSSELRCWLTGDRAGTLESSGLLRITSVTQDSSPKWTRLNLAANPEGITAIVCNSYDVTADMVRGALGPVAIEAQRTGEGLGAIALGDEGATRHEGQVECARYGYRTPTIDALSFVADRFPDLAPSSGCFLSREGDSQTQRAFDFGTMEPITIDRLDRSCRSLCTQDESVMELGEHRQAIASFVFSLSLVPVYVEQLYERERSLRLEHGLSRVIATDIDRERGILDYADSSGTRCGRITVRTRWTENRVGDPHVIADLESEVFDCPQ